MNISNTWLPLLSSIVSFLFAYFIFRRYLARRGPMQTAAEGGSMARKEENTYGW